MSVQTSDLTSFANACQILSRILCDPEQWEPGLVRSVGEIADSQAPEVAVAARAAEAAARAAIGDPLPLRVAHARLFIGPFRVDASPYASTYLEPDGQIMGPVSEQVAQTYAEAGLGPGTGPREAPDHVTHELEFLYYLGFEAVRTGSDEWHRRCSHFWSAHVSRWLPAFARRIVEADAHPFYTALGTLLLEFSRASNHRFAD